MAPNTSPSEAKSGHGAQNTSPTPNPLVAAAVSLNAALPAAQLLAAAAQQQSPTDAAQQKAPLVGPNPNQYLPASAPVSSLLPPIPAQQPGQVPNAAVQSQLMALLAGTAPSAVPPATTAAAPFAAPIPAQHAHHHHRMSRHHHHHHHRNKEQDALAALIGGVPSAMATVNMHSWSLEKLEQHVAMLERLKAPVPQTVALLLSDARRKKVKKEAKRMANRKSASTSRARKKALVQEMTEANARLKRQALILSLLPDLVIVIDAEGVITFCSAQVERVVHYTTDELVGTKLTDLLVPSSRGSLEKLIRRLVDSEKTGTSRTGRAAAKRSRQEGPVDGVVGKKSRVANVSSEGSGNVASAPADPSFPLSIVKVSASAQRTSDNDTSDASAKSERSSRGSKEQSSLTSTSVPRSVSAFNSGSDDNADKKVAAVTSTGKSATTSSDNSDSGTASTVASKLETANDNLERNVRWHNKKMMESTGTAGFKDDVTGADVTANNATARLSSLQHPKDSSLESSSEEDSGYRESNDSREETSSSGGDSSTGELKSGRHKPIAPTCNICLVRNDLTTIWCEVTSSVRTKTVPEETEESSTSDKGSTTRSDAPASKALAKNAESEVAPLPVNGPKELLLCLRPIRDGEKLKDNKRPFANKKGQLVTETSATSSGETSGLSSSEHQGDESQPPLKKRKTSIDAGKNEASQKTVVESLMLMTRST